MKNPFLMSDLMDGWLKRAAFPWYEYYCDCYRSPCPKQLRSSHHGLGQDSVQDSHFLCRVWYPSIVYSHILKFWMRNRDLKHRIDWIILYITHESPQDRSLECTKQLPKNCMEITLVSSSIPNQTTSRFMPRWRPMTTLLWLHCYPTKLGES